MHIPASKRVTVVLALFCAGLVVLGICLFWNYGVLRIRVAFANEQIQMFEEMRLRALKTPPERGCLLPAICRLLLPVWNQTAGWRQLGPNGGT